MKNDPVFFNVSIAHIKSSLTGFIWQLLHLYLNIIWKVNNLIIGKSKMEL